MVVSSTPLRLFANKSSPNSRIVHSVLGPDRRPEFGITSSLAGNVINLCLGKNIKCKISTPKYTQVYLKKSNLMNSGDGQKSKEKKKKKSKGDSREKSCNAPPKKGLHFIELAKISTCGNTRGVSADNVAGGNAAKKTDRHFKTTKSSKNKLSKVKFEVFIT